MDTLAERWAKLEPHVRMFGPDDGVPRPAVLLFHGCGGLRPHLPLYAEAAVKAGYRAFVVDSFGPRGWTREFALTFVCTGVFLQGSQRAGDVLAATWGVLKRPDVDPAGYVLAGWSHGSWSMMDLMTMPLTRPGEADLADPTPEPLANLKGMFLVYPYGHYPALSRTRDWLRTPPSVAVLASRDHVTARAAAMRLYDRPKASGAKIDIWEVEASHAFDEPTAQFPMTYDPLLTAEAHRRFQDFLASLLVKPAETEAA